jgi:hypothetical protein
MTLNAPLANSNPFGNSVVGEKQQSSKTSTPNFSESPKNDSKIVQMNFKTLIYPF